jgi:hypothetical protein
MMKNRWLSMLPALGALACATTYVPAKQQPPVQDGHTSVTVMALQQRTITVAYSSEAGTTFEPPRLSRSDETPCASGSSGRWGPRGLDLQGNFIVRESAGQLEAEFATLGAGPGMTLDLGYREGDTERCVRLPVTPDDDEVLWIAKPPLRQIGAGLHVEWPFQARGGLGPGAGLEARFMHNLGSWKVMGSFGMGFLWCSRDCPEWRIATLFQHLDAGAQFYRRVEFSGTALEAGAGINGRLALLVAEKDQGDSGGTAAFSWEPVLALRFLFFHEKPRLPGFSPLVRPASGPEISLARRFVYGRSPTGQDTVVTVGWAWTGAHN